MKGSTEENLETLDFKIKQGKIHLEFLTIEEKENNLGLINQELAEVKSVEAAIDEIFILGKKKRNRNGENKNDYYNASSVTGAVMPDSSLKIEY